ncbi:TRAP transporter small permease [Maritimibacter dapengensis]|uniref:TRAP transporter small permease protein n=1 Tax=Maritimibacter dapengensis TaxID=2836868 RepID=A0ABS6T620_9RHOB|nr:TRAP transporter small permease subunit [Maritimibacter dapengensis]MBV7379966.1 TRAP transporter small permease subunit [Maritimibacter dapengensis]
MIPRILNVWSRVETFLIGILLIIALVVFLGGGLLRIVAPGYAIDWATEVSIYFIIWATVLAGAAIVQEDRHLHTEVFIAALSPQLRRILGWAMSILSIAFIAVMLVYGWQAYEFSNLLDERSGSSLRAPQGFAVFLPLPIGMALILVRCALMLMNGQRPFGHLSSTPERGE